MTDPWTELRGRIREIELLNRTMAVLEWDQQVFMPSTGNAVRAEQFELMSALVHERMSDPKLGDLIAAAAQGADDFRKCALAAFARDRDRVIRVPAALNRALAHATAEGYPTWIEARKAENYDLFAPKLAHIVALKREWAECQVPAAHPYDTHVEMFEPGMTTSVLTDMFGRLAGQLSQILRGLDVPTTAVQKLPLPRVDQERIGRDILTRLGFRLDEGRLDVSVHPFSTGFDPGDVRLTANYEDDDFLSALYSVLHEGGHGMYEQGLPRDWQGTWISGAVSLGLHESQSRFWENAIGRSRPFVRWMKETYALPWSEDELFGAANQVRRSLIRIQADQVTYNLHIILRFELERDLMGGQLSITDLPEAWDAGTERLLGMRARKPTDGVLQDVHWSGGAIGYFPCYSLGNLYMASQWAKMRQDLPDVDAHIARGEFAPILEWLRTNIHRHGSRHEPLDLVRMAVGERDAVADLVTYLTDHHRDVAAA